MANELVKGLILGVAIGGVAGFLAGRGSAPAAAPAAQEPMAAPPAAVAPHADLGAAIFQLEQTVAREPQNLQAWIHLGNASFDAHLPQKAVDAYARALALDPRNVGVLTDQGVMYRELKAFDRALACFEAAQKLQPDHPQSLFNQGIVYAEDLKKPEKARPIFRRVMEKHPGTPHEQQAKEALERLGQASK